jgi:hypothetical protein
MTDHHFAETFMNKKSVVFLAAGLLGAALSIAGEPEAGWATKIAIVEDDSQRHEPFVLELSSDELGFNLQDLQIGESRAVVDDAGRNILITRTTDGYDFDVDGKSISMPALDGHAGLVQVGDFTAGNFAVEVMGDDLHFLDSATNGITIIAPTPLDESTKASIRSLLQSAGRPETVTFVDSSAAPHAHGAAKSMHKIKVVKAETITQ